MALYILFIGYILGIFIVPMSGTWTVSYSLESATDAEDFNIAYLYLNGEELRWSPIWTNSASGFVESTGGRTVFLKAQAGDTISLRTTVLDWRVFEILTCLEYNSV